MSIVYRDAMRGDGEALDHLFDSVFVGTFGHLYRPEDLDSFLTSYGVTDWEKDIADPECAFRIAETGGQVVGYVKLAPVTIPVETDRPAILLEQMYVMKEHHGAGIAAALMDWAFEEARRRGAEEIYLTVFTDNPRARRFYERCGFEAVGRYAFMVGNQADEDIIMRKRL
jgi:predicted N-acetyltransferase YhbS